MPFSSLNNEQFQAATAENGYNLVIASAGTGKTSTIVARIAHLIKNGVNPTEILLLTFTNKASSEMIARVAKIFDEKIASQIEAGTFHAVSYRILKKNQIDVVLKQPKELKSLFKTVYDKRDFFKFKASNTPYASNYLYDLYSLYLNVSPKNSFGEWICEKNSDMKEFEDIYQDIIDEFNDLKRAYGYVNFDDLLVLMRDFIKQNGSNYKEVLVDEYQDTNPLQNSLIKALNPKSLFCVGDYDQSIYAFNGSDISIIGSFDKIYPDAKVYSLTKNYRSTDYILSLANRVIEHNERIYPKKLEVVRASSSTPPKLLIYDELNIQYEEIAKLIKNSHTKHEEIAIIFRNNSTADGIEAHLREQNIACKRKGGISFFEAKEIKLLLDICTIVANPKDMMAFIHIFEYARGIGLSIAKELFDGLLNLGNGVIDAFLYPKDMKNPFPKRAKNIPLGLFDTFDDIDFNVVSKSRFKHLNIHEKLKSNPILNHPKLTDESVLFLNRFYEGISLFKNIKNPTTLIKNIVSSSLFSYLSEQIATKRAILKDKTIDLEQQERALENIKRKANLLIDLSKNYDDLKRFLNAMILGSSEMSEGSGVNLLTVHASKGLEFDDVYVIDLMEGRFPNKKLISLGGSLEEERRLFYVAVTRAKNRLFLSYAKKDDIKKIDYMPSIFLFEAGILKKEDFGII